MVYVLGMALFTVIMGNGFAAFLERLLQVTFNQAQPVAVAFYFFFCVNSSNRIFKILNGHENANRTILFCNQNGFALRGLKPSRLIAGVLGTAMVSKLQQKVSEGSALDQMAGLLEGEEQGVLQREPQREGLAQALKHGGAKYSRRRAPSRCGSCRGQPCRAGAT